MPLELSSFPCLRARREGWHCPANSWLRWGRGWVKTVPGIREAPGLGRSGWMKSLEQGSLCCFLHAGPLGTLTGGQAYWAPAVRSAAQLNFSHHGPSPCGRPVLCNSHSRNPKLGDWDTCLSPCPWQVSQLRLGLGGLCAEVPKGFEPAQWGRAGVIAMNLSKHPKAISPTLTLQLPLGKGQVVCDIRKQVMFSPTHDSYFQRCPQPGTGQTVPATPNECQ